VTKDCNRTYAGQVGGFCVIKSSTLDAIELESTVVYAQAADLTTGTLDSDVVLHMPGPGNNLAFGHCRVNLVTGVGQCTFSGGTGKFQHFHASVNVSPAQTAGFFAWDGTYSFSPHE
jgi:hypothetical protein